MTIDGRAEQGLHPEGMTPTQETLAAMFFDTKTLGKARKRYQNPDGSYRFEEVPREMGIIDFAQDEHEFAITEHISGNPSAPLSPFFLNIRGLNKRVLGQVGQVFAEMTPYFELHGHLPGPDVYAGVPKAGVPLAEAYSRATGIPSVEVFDKDGRQIVRKDDRNEGKTIRLIDDLVTKATTKLEAIKAAEEMGYIVDSFYVVVDREQGGMDVLKKELPAIDVRAAVKITQLFDFGLRTGRITREQYDRAVEYLTPGN